MHSVKRLSLEVILLLAFLVLSYDAGACINKKERQLKRIARDWCQLITASQIIPLYPLTQDIQPGDVMLVTTAIENQREDFENNGYLKLDQLLYRMHPSIEDYRSFYNGRYNYSSIGANSSADINNYQSISWDNLPLAFFPSYNFKVKTTIDAGLVLPVKGVPLAMSLSDTKEADGQLSIHKAHTYGIDSKLLYDSLVTWASDNRWFLQSYEPRVRKGIFGKHTDTTFLRVVSRVYAIDSLNVSLKSKSNSKPNLNNDKNSTAANNKGFSSDLMNKVSEISPRVSIIAESERNVFMTESFPEPIIVGYIGFDVPILKDGFLGVPISTLNQLKDEPRIETANITRSPQFSLLFLSDVYRSIGMKTDTRSKNIRRELDELTKHIPAKYQVNVYSIENKKIVVWRSIDNVVTRDTFEDYLRYASEMKQNIELLEKNAQQSKDEYQQSKKEFDRIMQQLQKSHCVHEAINNELYGN
jgi:hypothetical protein